MTELIGPLKSFCRVVTERFKYRLVRRDGNRWPKIPCFDANPRSLQLNQTLCRNKTRTFLCIERQSSRDDFVGDQPHRINIAESRSLAGKLFRRHIPDASRRYG